MQSVTWCSNINSVRGKPLQVTQLHNHIAFQVNSKVMHYFLIYKEILELLFQMSNCYFVSMY